MLLLAGVYSALGGLEGRKRGKTGDYYKGRKVMGVCLTFQILLEI